MPVRSPTWSATNGRLAREVGCDHGPVPSGRCGSCSAVSIRPERPTERAQIRDVLTAAFGSPAVARLVESIRASPCFLPHLSLVALLDEQVVGHVMISDAELHDGPATRQVANLSPLAVHPRHQGAGIGSALVREAIVVADELGEPLVVLEGAPDFYGRLGFEHSRCHGIEIPIPSWAPPEAAQVRILRAYDPSIRGRVVYPPAFAEVADD